MKKDSRSLSRKTLVNSLSNCDTDKERINILLDKVLQLQEELFEFKIKYLELYANLENVCVPVPF